MVHGVAGMKKTVLTKRYSLRLKVKTSKGKVAEHRILCYGLENIAAVTQPVTAKQLQKFSPNVPRDELIRPTKIDLLISHREGRLVPQPIKIVGDLVHWDGPLGKTIGGAHPDLIETAYLAVYRSETHLARTLRSAVMVYKKTIIPQEEKGNAIVRSTAATNKEVFEWFRWDSIGAACSPQCGGCKCGRCPPGGKEMTLKEEQDLEKIKECLTYVLADKHCNYPTGTQPIPGRQTSQHCQTIGRQWRQPSETLRNVWRRNLCGRLHTKNKYMKWSQDELLQNSNVRKSTAGKDLNPIRGVLLRFRSGLHAALGDIKKMYNSITTVWLNDDEVHLHRFFWRDNPEDDIEVGDKPAGCIAQFAMKKTANLPQFADMIEERRALTEDSYVDDILTSLDDLKMLGRITKGVESGRLLPQTVGPVTPKWEEWSPC